MENYINNTLNDIKNLKENWNDNGAKAFSNKNLLMAKLVAEFLAKELKKAPLIYPTAIGAIQLEYNFKKEVYLEFEVYDSKIKLFIMHKEDTFEATIEPENFNENLNTILKELIIFENNLTKDIKDLKTISIARCLVFFDELKSLFKYGSYLC